MNDLSEITNYLKKLNVKGIDDLCYSLEFKSTNSRIDLGTDISEVEWEILKDTFNKLKYLQKIKISNFETIYSHFIEKSSILIEIQNMLMVYLESVDKITYHYVHDINWNFDDPSESDIYSILLKSLNEKSPIDKLDLLVDGYSKLILLLEQYGLYAIYPEIDDSFLNKFNLKRKRM